MPRITLSNEQLIIYDDFLPQHDAEALLRYVNNDQFSIVHKNGWLKVWRLGDGLPLQGTTTMFRPGGRRKTRSPVDTFTNAMRDVLPEAAKLVGRPRTAWNAMSVTPWIYPAGTALSMHRDGNRYAASYAYFLHREWSFHWGGHLLILDKATVAAQPKFYPAFLSEEDEARLVAEPGLATCVLPRPNRLVLIAPAATHMVTRVDPNAGNHPRVSLAGFFVRPNRRRRVT